jgi:hypothetical protein
VSLEFFAQDEFRQAWLPKDFATEDDYLFRHFDVWKKITNPLGT